MSGGMRIIAASRTAPAIEQPAIIARGDTREPTTPPIAQPIVIVSQ